MRATLVPAQLRLLLETAGELLYSVSKCGMSFRPPYPSLAYEMNPDGECPARPGFFHSKGDTNGDCPHLCTFEFEGKA